MRKLIFMLIAAIAATMASCIGGNEGKWQNEKDSVMNVNEQQRQVLDDLTSSLIEVSASIDSIAAGEGMLRDASEGPVLTKEQMLENLATFKATLEENKSKLAELEKKILNSYDFGKQEYGSYYLIVISPSSGIMLTDGVLGNLEIDRGTADKAFSQVLGNISDDDWNKAVADIANCAVSVAREPETVAASVKEQDIPSASSVNSAPLKTVEKPGLFDNIFFWQVLTVVFIVICAVLGTILIVFVNRKKQKHSP